VNAALCLWTNLLTKVSLFVFFLRIFTSKSHRIAAYAALVLCTAMNLAAFWFVLFSCGTPATFSITALKGQCNLGGVGTKQFWYAHTSFNLFGELVVIGLGASSVMKTTMNWDAKISVLFIFLLASG
jgi:hypothetical protein